MRWLDAIPASPIRLRVCAAATAPGRLMPSPVTAFAYVDVVVAGPFDLLNGAEQPAFKIAAEPVRTEPPVSPSAASAEDLERAFWSAPAPDLFVGHRAGILRTVAPGSVAHARWVCTQKVARQVWRDAPGYGMDDLLAWRGIGTPAGPAQAAAGPRTVVDDARLTARLLTELLETAAAVIAMESQSIAPLPPLRPAPDLSDDLGWAALPDDELRWFFHVPAAEGGRARAEQEIERRVKGGWATDLIRRWPSGTA